jgi:hypothetical protein
MWTVRYFKAKRFNWLGLSKQRTLRAKVRRIAGQLLPWSYESFDWQLTSGALQRGHTFAAPARCPSLMARTTVHRSATLPAERRAPRRHDELRAERLLPEARVVGAAAKRA